MYEQYAAGTTVLARFRCRMYGETLTVGIDAIPDSFTVTPPSTPWTEVRSLLGRALLRVRPLLFLGSLGGVTGSK